MSIYLIEPGVPAGNCISVEAAEDNMTYIAKVIFSLLTPANDPTEILAPVYFTFLFCALW